MERASAVAVLDSTWQRQAKDFFRNLTVEVADSKNAAYPFHPALIDVMRERWAAVDPFQRTRGALRFLSSSLHALKQDGGARALLGPAEIPLKNVEVREKRRAGKQAIVWSETSGEIPNDEPRFLVAYLPLEFVAETKSEQEKRGLASLTQYGDKPRRYRNGIGLAIPEKKQVEAQRRAMGYLLAIDRVAAVACGRFSLVRMLTPWRETQASPASVNPGTPIQSASQVVTLPLYGKRSKIRFESEADSSDAGTFGGGT